MAAIVHYQHLTVLTILVTVHVFPLTDLQFLKANARNGHHASIFFLTPEGESVHLNMVDDSCTDNNGTLIVKHCEFQHSRTEIQNFDLEAKSNLTVGQVLSLLYHKRCHKYEYTEEVVGCRFWVAKVVDDLHASGFIQPTAISNASLTRTFLEYNYSLEGPPRWDPMVPGRFC
ncbi:unnamed protein product [Penicillium pancosmium]